MIKMIQTRRKFISAMAVGGAGLSLMPGKSIFSGQEKKRFPVRLFSKPLDSYDFSFMCECVAGAGIPGLDLTVRPGGKVEPEAVEHVLPQLIDEAKKFNLVTDMIVTGILSAKDPFTERILRTASEAGVKYYRLGWFNYDTNTGLLETLRKYNQDLTEIAALNKKYNIHGGYQNHSGEMVGGPVWDLRELLRDLPPEYIGSQFDVRHAKVEGHNTWMLGMRLMAGHIKTLAIKDFTWKTTGGKPEPVTVPLGEGMIDWDRYFTTIRDLKINAPVTLHVEYPLLGEGEEKLSLNRQQEIIVGKLKKDADFINAYLRKYELD
jgi:sugar phosphate isomerase/epimerase